MDPIVSKSIVRDLIIIEAILSFLLGSKLRIVSHNFIKGIGQIILITEV